jgi:hypothetical protein
VQLLRLFHGAVGDRRPAELAADALTLLNLPVVLDAAVAEVAVGEVAVAGSDASRPVQQ